jgi:acyl-homoserine lactone acylase PvdQ
MRFGRLLRILAGLVVVAALVGAAAFLWLRASGRAQRSGEAAIAGLGGRVEVRFDAAGVPFVTAGSARDAAAALGWLHANDRMFQMELTRRAAVGRLAELFGERALGFDRRIRRLGFPAANERLLAAASAGTRELLEAYAGGVNAWLEARGGDLPPEFRILRHRPEPWRPADSVAVIFVMARTLSPVTDPPEDDYFRFLRAFGPERARELAGDADAVIFEEVERLARELAAAPEALGRRAEGSGLGSNNWAVAPARSANGRALVANDPHLGLGLPNVWYVASLDAPDYRALGMTLPGAPGVVLGRGPKLAWACTNLYVDDVDVFVERLDETGTKVLRGEAWVPITVTTDTIRVHGGEPVAVEVRSTDRGPLLDADPERGLPARSLAWVGWEGADQMAAFVALARAGSVEEVPAAVASFAFPAQNVVAADAAGRLVWTPLGRAPARFGWDGRFAAPAWRADVGWNGLVPAAENPVLLDPEAGLITTANSFLPVAQPAWFEGDFDTPFRMERIRELLAARSDWSVAALARLQSDVVSPWARLAVARIGVDYEGDAGRAARTLAAWDGAMSARGPAALFALVERELLRAVFEDEAERAGLPRFGTRWRLLRALEGEISPAWFDDVATPAVEDRRATLAGALERAWRDGVARWGERVETWPYDTIHTLTLGHALDSAPLVGRWFERGPFALPGSATTVLALHGPWVDGAIDIAYGPSMRLVTDAGDPDSTVAVLPGGQSGHPADPRYDDQLPLWLAGETRPLPWRPEAVERAAVERLALVPAGGGAR